MAGRTGLCPEKGPRLLRWPEPIRDRHPGLGTRNRGAFAVVGIQHCRPARNEDRLLDVFSPDYEQAHRRNRRQGIGPA